MTETCDVLDGAPVPVQTVESGFLGYAGHAPGPPLEAAASESDWRVTRFLTDLAEEVG